MDDEESLLRFPCDFPIKAMGKADADFDARVVELVRKYAPDLTEGAVSTRLSRNGKYMAVTVTIQATSRRQLDDIYMELTASEHVMMAL